MIICCSGHRPNKLPFGYQENNPFELAFKKKLKEIIISINPKPIKALFGGAQGMDIWFGQVCLELQIPVSAYIPFRGYESRWPIEKQKSWHELLSRCAEVKYICDGGYAAWKMQKRNEAMSDDSDLAIILYNGNPHGGTYNFVQYREKSEKDSIIISPRDINYT
jgi:uncharacterized phage-like protein YoqJ